MPVSAITKGACEGPIARPAIKMSGMERYRTAAAAAAAHRQTCDHSLHPFAVTDVRGRGGHRTKVQGIERQDRSRVIARRQRAVPAEQPVGASGIECLGRWSLVFGEDCNERRQAE